MRRTRRRGIAANLAALGLVAADMTPITTNQTLFNTGFAAHSP